MDLKTSGPVLQQATGNTPFGSPVPTHAYIDIEQILPSDRGEVPGVLNTELTHETLTSVVVKTPFCPQS